MTAPSLETAPCGLALGTVVQASRGAVDSPFTAPRHGALFALGRDATWKSRENRSAFSRTIRRAGTPDANGAGSETLRRVA